MHIKLISIAFKILLHRGNNSMATSKHVKSRKNTLLEKILYFVFYLCIHYCYFLFMQKKQLYFIVISTGLNQYYLIYNTI